MKDMVPTEPAPTEICRGCGQRVDVCRTFGCETDTEDQEGSVEGKVATYQEGVPPDAVWSWDEEEGDVGCEDCRWTGDTYEEAEEHCEEKGHAVYVDVRKVFVWHRPPREERGQLCPECGGTPEQSPTIVCANHPLPGQKNQEGSS